MTNRDATPLQARKLFLKSKQDTVKPSTSRAYKFPTKHFVRFLHQEGIESMQDVDGFTVQRWMDERKDENVAPATFRSNVKHVKTFIGYCQRVDLVDPGLFDKIEVPNIPDETKASSDVIKESMATKVRNYLEITDYASVYHVTFELIWETGCRISGALALDVSDYHPSRNALHFRNRKSTGTALKNGNKSERNVTISDDLIEIINDYIEVRLPDTMCEHGREPLLATNAGRLTRQRAYKNMIGFTRPCVYDGGCPHGREIDDCEAAQKKKKAFGCPSSQSMHPLRRGSITNHLNRGWPKEKVSERCDVSVSVLERHYNEQTNEDKREQRMKYVDRL